MNTTCIRILAALAVVFAVRGTALAVNVTCGQTVPTGQAGVLTGDLDCPDSANPAIILERGARLNLNGFTLTGSGAEAAVYCSGSCKVNGPGTITGVLLGIFASGHPVTVKGVTIANTGADAIRGTRVTITDSTITGSGRNAVSAEAVGAIKRSVLSNNVGYGVFGPTVKVAKSHILDNGAGGAVAYIDGQGGKLRASDSVITGNGNQCTAFDFVCADVWGGDVQLRRTTCVTQARFCQ